MKTCRTDGLLAVSQHSHPDGSAPALAAAFEPPRSLVDLIPLWCITPPPLPPYERIPGRAHRLPEIWFPSRQMIQLKFSTSYEETKNTKRQDHAPSRFV